MIDPNNLPARYIETLPAACNHQQLPPADQHQHEIWQCGCSNYYTPTVGAGPLSRTPNWYWRQTTYSQQGWQ